MTTITADATITVDAPAGEADKPRKPEAPNANKTRWMLWMPNDLLADLKVEAERVRRPAAALVRDTAEAGMALTAEERDALAAEAERKGVSLAEIYHRALSQAAGRLVKKQQQDPAAA